MNDVRTLLTETLPFRVALRMCSFATRDVTVCVAAPVALLGDGRVAMTLVEVGEGSDETTREGRATLLQVTSRNRLSICNNTIQSKLSELLIENSVQNLRIYKYVVSC